MYFNNKEKNNMINILNNGGSYDDIYKYGYKVIYGNKYIEDPEELTEALYKTDIYIILETEFYEAKKITYYNFLEMAILKFEALKPAENEEILLFKGNLYLEDQFEQLKAK